MDSYTIHVALANLDKRGKGLPHGIIRNNFSTPRSSVVIIHNGTNEKVCHYCNYKPVNEDNQIRTVKRWVYYALTVKLNFL